MGEANRRKLVDDVTKALIDDGKLIEAGWRSLRSMAVPKDAPQVQLDEMRMSFFAGAQHLFGSLMSALDPDAEPTPSDMRRMEAIDSELREFLEDFKAKYLADSGAGGDGARRD